MIGMPTPILWSHPLKMQRIVLLNSLLWWELGTNSLITGPGEWLSFRRFTSKLSWSWSCLTTLGYILWNGIEKGNGNETCVCLRYLLCLHWLWLNIFKCFAPFSYRLPVNPNNYTEKGQTESLGNGRCTDEKRNQRPDDILDLCLWYTSRSPNILLLSSKSPNLLLSHIVFYNKPCQDLDVKKKWLIYHIFVMPMHAYRQNRHIHQTCCDKALAYFFLS